MQPFHPLILGRKRWICSFAPDNAAAGTKTAAGNYANLVFTNRACEHSIAVGHFGPFWSVSVLRSSSGTFAPTSP